MITRILTIPETDETVIEYDNGEHRVDVLGDDVMTSTFTARDSALWQQVFPAAASPTSDATGA